MALTENLFLFCQICRREKMECGDPYRGLLHYELEGKPKQLSCNGKIIHNRKKENHLKDPEFPFICEKCGNTFQTPQSCRKFNMEAAVPAGSPPTLRPKRNMG